MIGVVIAMPCEADILKQQMQTEAVTAINGKQITIGTFAGVKIALLVCGVGKINAAAGAQILIDRYDVAALVNFGVAGGIKENTETRGVYLIDGAIEYDFDLSELNGTKIGTPDELKDNLLPLSPLPFPLPLRRLATGDRFNDDKKDYLLILDYMQADIRDMEGAAVARIALQAGVPVFELKAISDKAGNKSSFEQYRENRDGALANLQAVLPDFFRAIAEQTADREEENTKGETLTRIPSFCKDHDLLQPGFYVSTEQNGITTFDLRFKKPNAGDYVSPKASHTIEHILATLLRNSDKKDDIVYFGPMGCRTGFYLLTVHLTYGEALALVKECLAAALAFTSIPGSQRQECGNYLEHDLEGAKAECAAYLRLLETMS